MTSKFLDVLAAMVSRGPQRKQLEPAYVQLARSAPVGLRPLLNALARHEPHVELGWRELDREYESFESVFEVFDITDEYENYFDPARALLLGRWPGGEVFFGPFWEGAKVRFAEVDPENSQIKRWDSCEEWFSRICDDELERSDMEREPRPAGVLEVAKKLGKKVAPREKDAPAPKRAAVKKGQPRLVPAKLPPPPGQQAAASRYPNHVYLTFSDTSPAGRYVVGHDWENDVAAELRIVDAGGKLRKVPVDERARYRGMALVPGAERVLCTPQDPGDLVELELETGAVTHRGLTDVRQPSFIDDDHVSLVKMTDEEHGELQVYRYRPAGSLGKPLASVPLKEPTDHCAVNGYSLVWAAGEKGDGWRLHRFDGKRLVDLGGVAGPMLVGLSAKVVDGKTYFFARYDGWFELVV